MAGYSNQKVFILYEDEHLLVVKKPFGMESQRGKSFAMDQESLLRGYLGSFLMTVLAKPKNNGSPEAKTIISGCSS